METAHLMETLPTNGQSLLKPLKKPCLIVILGGTRAHHLTWHKFKVHVLDELKCDMAVCMSTKNESMPSDPFSQNAKYKWLYPEPEDWADAVNFAAQTENKARDSWRSILRVSGILFGFIKDPLLENTRQSSAVILLFYRWFLLHSILREDVDKLYDRFILTRSDYLYELSHPPLELLSPEYVWIPTGQDYGGITDRHTIFSPSHLVSILSPLRDMILEPDALYEVLQQHKSWNIEKYLAFHFYNQGILHKVRRVPLCMYTVRDHNDTAWWLQGKWNKELGFFIKYPGEYADTRKTVDAMNGSSWKAYVLKHSFQVKKYAFAPLSCLYHDTEFWPRTAVAAGGRL
jgi:hypothetical protein